VKAFTNGVVDESKISEFVAMFPERTGPLGNLAGTVPVPSLTQVASDAVGLHRYKGWCMAPIHPVPLAALGGYFVNLNMGRPCQIRNATGQGFKP